MKSVALGVSSAPGRRDHAIANRFGPRRPPCLPLRCSAAMTDVNGVRAFADGASPDPLRAGSNTTTATSARWPAASATRASMCRRNVSAFMRPFAASGGDPPARASRSRAAPYIWPREATNRSRASYTARDANGSSRHTRLKAPNGPLAPRRGMAMSMPGPSGASWPSARTTVVAVARTANSTADRSPSDKSPFGSPAVATRAPTHSLPVSRLSRAMAPPAAAVARARI